MRPLSLALVTLLLGCAPAFGQTVTAETIGKQKTGVVPIELSVPVPPTAFRGDGLYHLCYEIHLANLSSITWRVQNIEVMNQSGGLLLTVAGKGLDGVLFHPARARDAKAAPGADIAPGEAVIAYMWVDLAKDAALPSGLQNQISVRTGDTADVAEAEVPSVKVRAKLAWPSQRVAPLA